VKKLLPFIILILAFTASAQKSGTYQRSDQYGRGEIKITEIKKGKTKLLKFAIWVAGAVRGTCIGDFEGIAKWESSNTAEYNGDFNEVNSEGEAIGCRLTFIFSGNSIIVREHECNDFHGASCGFEGTYKRKIIKSKKK
jgi:hypothetical protein